jgi:glycosyltransferase involved in cell wall biosynthesis
MPESGTNVLFCGNDWRIKNGPLAVQVMARLAAKHPAARFIYLGHAPPQTQVKLPTNFRLLGSVPRTHAQALFAGAHILFHPARSESFGMVLLEAAASGLAIVCGGGRGMEHVGEIVDAEGAAILDRDVCSPDDEEPMFEALLDGLLADRVRTQGMGLRNHARVETTTLCLRNRNAALAAIYRRALETAASRGLREEDLGIDPSLAIHRISGAQVQAAEQDFRRRHAFSELSVRFEMGRSAAQ